jgi:adenylate kinase family enzyme
MSTGPHAGPRRILVYGVTGSGKSTLARRIGARFSLPYCSVDDLTWEPGWVAVPLDVQRERIAAVCAGDAWVLDAAYGAWLDTALSRAQLVVGLDLPRWRSLGRLLRRTAIRLVLRTEVCNGNRESLRNLLSAESLILWHFQSYARNRRRMRAWLADPAGPPVVLLRSPREVRRWLAAADLSAPSGGGRRIR